MDLKLIRPVVVVCCLIAVVQSDLTSIDAASPESITLGRELFTQDWSPSNPALLGKDGLGPLFNAKSCVACHHQGGAGGAGKAAFNAKTLNIESMRVEGAPMSEDVVRSFLVRFHPGFVDPEAGIVNSTSLPHQGGTAQLTSLRENMNQKTKAEFSPQGGSSCASEVRRSRDFTILHTDQQNRYRAVIRARMFQRNTTALFGAGLIGQVTVAQLRAIERNQRAHSEISGRLATLSDGRIGRYGWRGDVPDLLHFCERACAGELGLQSRRVDQPLDPTDQAYRNPSHDVSDDQIRSIADFIATLPAPKVNIPADSEARRTAERGHQLFKSIGCSVCHQENVGPALGIFSDLLLHDMGPKLYDLNPADPYIVKITPDSSVRFVAESSNQATQTFSGQGSVGNSLYGGQSSMSPSSSRTSSFTSFSSSASQRPSVVMTIESYDFQAPETPEARFRLVPIRVKSRIVGKSSRKLMGTEIPQLENTLSNGDFLSRTIRNAGISNVRQTQVDSLKLKIEPTNINQEWRTAPLWGVRDSAPYLHDGRAETLLEAIVMHGGESAGTRDRFLALPLDDRQSIIEFLHTLVAPPNLPQRPPNQVVAANPR